MAKKEKEENLQKGDLLICKFNVTGDGFRCSVTIARLTEKGVKRVFFIREDGKRKKELSLNLFETEENMKEIGNLLSFVAERPIELVERQAGRYVFEVKR